jgi:glutaminyl-peptide cyclotransferase
MEPLQKEASSLRPGADVLNGIAFDSANNKILVTGKRWPFVYEIKLQ